MIAKSKALLSMSAVLCAAGFLLCAVAEAKGKNTQMKSSTEMVMYRCPKCKSQIQRDTGKKGFIGTCPKCGEKFLTF